MKELLFSVFSVCLFSSAVSYLCPDGKGSLIRLIRTVCSVCVCACLISPIASVIGNAPELSVKTPSFSPSEAAGEAVAEAVCRSIEDELEIRLQRDFGILHPRLTLTVDAADPTAVVIASGVLSGGGANLEQGAEHVSSLLGCPIAVEEDHE